MPIERFRTGKLRNATLPELAEWGREHPEAQKIAASTINKLLGQAVGRWARGLADLIPEEWADPFSPVFGLTKIKAREHHPTLKNCT